MSRAPVADLPLDRFAVVVGITAHRDASAEHDAEFALAFRSVLDELAATYPATPVVVLSSFCSAVDLIAAEVALARAVPVVAMLPAPAQTCREAFFVQPRDRDRFDAALDRCARVDIASQAPDPDRACFEAGMRVAYYSDVLAAFWDGGAAGDVAGTTGVVNARLGHTPADHALLAGVPVVPDIGPIFQIVTPRSGQPAAPDVVLRKRFPERFRDDAACEADFTTSLAAIDRLNRDLQRAVPSTAVPTIDALRERVDAAATRLQRITFRALYVLYAIALCGTAAQYTDFELVKYACFPLAFGVYQLARRFDYENRYQDYRALSEGLRVQSAWLRAGVRERVERSYLSMHDRELAAIRVGLRYAYLAFGESAAGSGIDAGRCRDWIDEQWNYFRTAGRTESTRLERLGRISRTTFRLAILVSVVCFGILYLPTLPDVLAHALDAVAGAAPMLAGPTHAWANDAAALEPAWQRAGPFPALAAWDAGAKHAALVKLSTAALAMSAAVAFVVSKYAEKRGFALNAQRYDRMFAVFDRGRSRLDGLALSTSPAAAAIVVELGRAALAESGDWLLTRRQKPLSLVS